MDIPRKSAAKKRLIRRIIYGAVGLIAVVGISVGLDRLKPAAPTVDSPPWIDAVKRGPMRRDVRGLGTLVPEDTLLIPALGLIGLVIAAFFSGQASNFFESQFNNAPKVVGVVDQTGLTGVWQFELPLSERPQQRPPGLEPVANDPNPLSLITALQEQLGLKLESIQGPIEFLVVDHVERLDREDGN